jgi:hypothetical protein
VPVDVVQVPVRAAGVGLTPQEPPVGGWLQSVLARCKPQTGLLVPALRDCHPDGHMCASEVHASGFPAVLNGPTRTSDARWLKKPPKARTRWR